MRRSVVPTALTLALAVASTGCGDGGTTEPASTGTTTASPPATTTAPTTTDSTIAPYRIAGRWTDTDVVGANSCGLAQPAAGSSRITPNIVLRQTGRRVTLTAPPNIAGTQTVARGTMADDGSMTLSGSDAGTRITLTLRVESNDRIVGTSQVVADGCTYNFANSLTRSR